MEIAAHYDGQQVVFDEPIEPTAGTELKIRVVESDEARKARQLAALRALGELGRGSPILPDRYLDDRETYYDDHRAGIF